MNYSYYERYGRRYDAGSRCSDKEPIMTAVATVVPPPFKKHAGPPLALVATIYTALFIAGLYPVTIFGGTPHFPGPWESPEVISRFFQIRPEAAAIGASLHFGAAIALGIFAVTAVSRL